MWTQLGYETTAQSIATAIWEISTKNGLIADGDGSYMQNCHDAAASTWYGSIDFDTWYSAALNRVGRELQ